MRSVQSEHWSTFHHRHSSAGAHFNGLDPGDIEVSRSKSRMSDFFGCVSHLVPGGRVRREKRSVRRKEDRFSDLSIGTGGFNAFV